MPQRKKAVGRPKKNAASTKNAETEDSSVSWEDVFAVGSILRLQYASSSGKKCVTLFGGAAYIGRIKHLRLSICEEDVSQVHALIESDSASWRWKIKDLDSSCGTTVNGKSVSCKRATYLQHGDIITLSDSCDIHVQIESMDEYSLSCECVLDNFFRWRADAMDFHFEKQIVDTISSWEEDVDRICELREAG